jgi:hypothetical protein
MALAAFCSKRWNRSNRSESVIENARGGLEREAFEIESEE